MKKNKKYIILGMLFICILYCFLNSDNISIVKMCNYPNMEIEFSSTNYQEGMVVFYDSGKEVVFDDQHIQVYNIRNSNTFQKAVFQIPLEGLKNLRIDLGNSAGRTQIKSIIIRKNLFEEKKLEGEEILRFFPATNFITKYILEEYVTIEYDEGDPFIRSILLDDIKYDRNILKGIMTIFKIIVCCLIISVGIFVIIVSTFKKRNIIIREIKKILCDSKTKKWLKYISCIILILSFVSVPIYFTVDSAWYLSYLKYFEGREAFGSWQLIRGWFFPALLYVASKIFGLTSQGMLCPMLLFYMATIVFCLYFFSIIQKQKEFKYLKYLIVFIIAFNPIIFGYYHVLLTEFVGATLCIINLVCFLGLNYKRKGGDREKIFLSIIILSINLIISYSVKQTYIAFIIIPYVMCEILFIAKNRKKSEIGVMLITVTLAMISLFGSNRLWMNYVKNGNFFDGTRRVSGDVSASGIALSSSLVNGATYFQIVDENTVAILNDRMDVESTFQYPVSENSSLSYVIRCFKESPQKLIKGYIDNYLVLTNFYGRGEDRKSAIKEPSFNRGNENSKIASAFGWYSRGHEFYVDQGYESLGEIFQYNDLTQFKFPVDSSKIIEVLYKNKYVNTLSKATFTFCLMLAPILFVGLLTYILFCIIKNRNINIKMEICFIMESTVFGYIAALAILNNQIDRYCFPVFIVAILATFLIFYEGIRFICNYIMSISGFRRNKNNE